MGSDLAALDRERFRRVLRNVPTPVTVVTATTPDGPTGLAVGSFVSVSLDPLLIGFFPARTSRSWPSMRAVGRFCVNVLAANQEQLSRAFAASGVPKFAGVSWRAAPSGAPILNGCVAWIDSEQYAEHEAGDHMLVLGRVTAFDVERPSHALLFHRGDYASTAGRA